MNIISKTLEVAENEFKNRYQLEIFDGSKRVIEYFKAAGITQVGQDSAWCAAFVYWCLDRACSQLGKPNEYFKSAYCPDIYKMADEKKLLKKKGVIPCSGDVFLRIDNGYEGFKAAGHTGFVLKIEGDKFCTIEGNTTDGTCLNGDTVCEKWRPINGTPGKNYYLFIDTAKIFCEEALMDMTEANNPLEVMHEVYRIIDKVDIDEVSKKRILVALNKFNQHRDTQELYQRFRASAALDEVPDMFRIALKFTLKWEGGLSDDPLDPGGRTNRGITQRVYDGYRNNKALPLRDVKNIDESELLEIYREKYWKPSKADTMIELLAIVQFDTAVNFGVSGAVMFLQEALGFTGRDVDGDYGPKTETALKSANNKETAFKIVEGRIAYRYKRVHEKPSQERFLQGWLNRDNDLKRFIEGR